MIYLDLGWVEICRYHSPWLEWIHADVHNRQHMQMHLWGTYGKPD